MRAHGYDGTANMSGKYIGVQVRLLPAYMQLRHCMLLSVVLRKAMSAMNVFVMKLRTPEVWNVGGTDAGFKLRTITCSGVAAYTLSRHGMHISMLK
jgi:hypothetical protein